MKQITIFGALVASAAVACAGTPTIDGTFDGAPTWGSPVATNVAAGWNGFSATDLYVTSDATYAYFGVALSDLFGNWQTYGFAIHTTAGGGNTQDPWGRQFNFNLTNAPDFLVRGNLDNTWAELRTWNGTDWNTGSGTSIIPAGHASGSSSFVEVRVPRATLAAATTEVVFVLSGNDNAHGLFDALPQDIANNQNADVADQWNESPQNVVNTATAPTAVPVTVSSFSID